MREFKALKPENLPEGFDFEVHSEEPVVDVKESAGKITIDYVFPGFYMDDDSCKIAGKKMKLKRINIRSTGFLTESGKPLLPSFGRYVQIPYNCDYKVTIKKSKPVQFDNVVVIPAQTMMSDSHAQKHEIEYDKKFYSKDVLYPKDIVNVTGPFWVDQYHALLVHVTPLQYNPAKKSVLGYGNITVTIQLTEIKGKEAKPVTEPVSDNDTSGNLMLNPGVKIAAKIGFKIPPVFFKATGPELLIIYAKVFEKAAKRLASWKNRRGIITDTVCIDTIGNNVDKIKAHIRGMRGKLFSRLRYVLLFGDSDMIVTQIDFQSIYGAVGWPTPPDHIATDYYYSTRYDKNTPDPANPQNKLFYPWLSVGRIPVRPDNEGAKPTGDSQAQEVVDQIVAYEKNPPADPSFYKRMVFAAYFQGTNHKDTRGYLTTIERIRTHMETLGYDTERVYVTNDQSNTLYYQDGTVIPADVMAAMTDNATATQMLVDSTTEGQLYIGHRDHGSWNGWVDPPFTNSDLDNVTGDIPTVFYSINCETGSFDFPEPTECFAEKNLRMKGTAPSLIAATRDSGTYLNNDLINGLFDATFGGVLPTFPGGNASYPLKNNRIGDVLNYGKSYLPVVNSGNEDGVKDHFEIYHVIGDPTLELWRELPLTVKLKASIINQAIDIRLSTCPRGSVITIWYGTKMLKRLTPSSNHITVPIKGLVPIRYPQPIFPKPYIAVCFSAPGYRYNEVKVKMRVLSPIPL